MDARRHWQPVLAGATVAVAAGTLVLAARWLTVSPDVSEVTFLAVMAVLGMTSAVLGLVVALRRPTNVVGPLLGLVGLVPCLLGLNDTYVAVGTRVPYALPVSGWWLALSSGAWMVIYVPAAVLVLFFPDGRLIGPRWRYPAIGLVVIPVVYTAACAFTQTSFPHPYEQVRDPVPLAQGGWRVAASVVQGLCLIGLLALLASAFGALVARYRRGTPQARAQLKWLGLGAAFLPGTLLLCWLSFVVLRGPELVGLGLICLFLAIPVATAIAMLRHDLYDIDRALATTATYGLVSAALLAFFTVAAFLGGLVTGSHSAAVAAAATAICAAVLAPLRHGLQSAVDRRLYPKRQAALAAIERLRVASHAGTAKPEGLQRVLVTALGDPLLKVLYRPPGSDIELDADGRTSSPLQPDQHSAAVVLGGDTIGSIVAGPTISRTLLREIASAASLLVEVVRLRTGLAEAVRDIAASRTRLLQVGYDERRRFERDLHDGAQQRLVSLGMNLRVAQRHVHDPAVDLDVVLGEAVDQLVCAVSELRAIAHGLRPSSLDDGLGPALTTMASHLPVPVSLEIAADGIPDSIATTAYYVVSEAVTNAVKHADAARIGLKVHQVDGSMIVRVSDDGAGGAQIMPGTGLSALTDRVSAAGGWLRVDSPLGNGTVVEAVLPCGS